MSVVVVDYGVGNLGSIPNMLARIGVEARVTSEPEAIRRADRLILPGVGAFDAGMASLEARGIRGILEARVLGDHVPTLGLCLGMHLLFDGSEEGRRPGLGWVPGRVIRFRSDRMAAPVPIPNMGWHDLHQLQADPLLAGLEHDARFYFAHAYHAEPTEPGTTIALAEYGYSYPACIRRGSLVAAQFHPEKSHRFGLRFLQNFVLG